MGEYLPDGTYQSYTTECPDCGETVKCNMQGNIFSHKCQQQPKEEHGWIKVSERYPNYYDDVWVSDGNVVLHGRLVGRSFTPNKKIFKEVASFDSNELCGITHWMKLDRPLPPNISNRRGRV